MKVNQAAFETGRLAEHLAQGYYAHSKGISQILVGQYESIACRDKRAICQGSTVYNVE
jgi:hypothetical protein